MPAPQFRPWAVSWSAEPMFLPRCRDQRGRAGSGSLLPPHSHRWKACCNPCLKRTVKLVSNATTHLSTVRTAVGFFPPQIILVLSSTFLQGSLGGTISHNQIKSYMTTASFYRQKNTLDGFRIYSILEG